MMDNFEQREKRTEITIVFFVNKVRNEIIYRGITFQFKILYFNYPGSSTVV